MSRFDVSRYLSALEVAPRMTRAGRVSQVVGLTVESDGPEAKIGDICRIKATQVGTTVDAEVVGFRDSKVLLMPFRDLGGVSQGDAVVSTGRQLAVAVGHSFVGRILNALGDPIDDKGPLTVDDYYNIDNDPPNPLTRERVKRIMPLGVKALDGLLTIGRGQRVGIFAGSGVGKSTLMGMIARNALSDVNVIVLIGERGREVRDFIEKDLREEGLAKTVLIIATSDQPALLRFKSAQLGTSIAEYFRDQGKDVLLMMDSLTRFAMAQREIGMSTGEPPVSRGYTPSVYAKLPRLLERSGTSDKGSITGLYTVLVEGDDMNEPIADTVRGILDGHMVLNRQLANANHYPPIDILQSISRCMNDIVDPEHMQAANALKGHMAVYREARDLINIGAYKKGSNPSIDQAIRLNEPINAFLKQAMTDSVPYERTRDMVLNIVGPQGNLA